MRCERCRTSELTLVSFGVYRCHVCGVVDADGNLLQSDSTEPSGRADQTQPNVHEHEIVEAGRSSFAAPPPISPMAAAVMAAPSSPSSSRTTSSSPGFPKLFLATAVVLGMIDMVGAVQSGSFIMLLLQASSSAALVTGKPWARTLAMGGAVLIIGLAAMAFVMVHGRAPYGPAGAVMIVINGWWLYVLLRPDTVAYFSR